MTYNAYDQVVEGLKSALLDQRATAVFYAQMRDLSQSYDGVEAFAEARKDELDHALKIAQLLEELTGTKPGEASQPVQPPAFKSYCEGIMLAIQGEKNAGEEYAKIISISPYQNVNIVLTEILADEEYHLAKFKKLYEMECKNRFYSK